MFNPNKPPKQPSENKLIGVIDLNSAEIRKETPESRKERARLEVESGVKANVYKNKKKYDRNEKHKKKSFE